MNVNNQRKNLLSKKRTNAWFADDGAKAKAPVALAALFRGLSFLSEMVEWLGVSALTSLLMVHFIKNVPAIEKHLWILNTTNLSLGFALLTLGVLGKSIFRNLSDRALASAEHQARRYREQNLIGYLLPVELQSSKEIVPAVGANMSMESIDAIAHHKAKVSMMKGYAVIASVVLLVTTALIHWPVTVLLLLATLVMPMNMMVAGKLAQEGHRNYLAQLNSLSNIIVDSFRGLETLIRFDGVKKRRRIIKKASDQLVDANYNILKKAFISATVMDIVITFAIAVIATYIGMSLLNYVHVPHSSINLVGGLYLLLLTPMFFTPFREMAAAFHEKERAVASAKELSEKTNVEIDSFEAPSALSPLGIAPNVTSENVTFTRGDNTFKIGDFTVEPKNHVALIGKSGSGKTTLLKLLSGVLTPQSGSISWGIKNTDMSPEIQQCAWIGQETLIVPGTLAMNLRLGNSSATNEELLDALQIANLDAWAQSLSQQLKTNIGFGYLDPSAGEKKRIAIARAYLRGAKLWFLDEPTAHLDEENEEAMIKAIQKATINSTTIVVTHSHKVLELCDVVYQMSNDHELKEVHHE